MSGAQKALLGAISNMDRFAAHGTGFISGATSSFEQSLIVAARDAQLLRAALESQKGIVEALDQFEGSFQAMAVLSTATMHGTRTAQISDAELEDVLDKVDAVREEL